MKELKAEEKLMLANLTDMFDKCNVSVHASITYTYTRAIYYNEVETDGTHKHKITISLYERYNQKYIKKNIELYKTFNDIYNKNYLFYLSAICKDNDTRLLILEKAKEIESDNIKHS